MQETSCCPRPLDSGAAGAQPSVSGTAVCCQEHKHWEYTALTGEELRLKDIYPFQINIVSSTDIFKLVKQFFFKATKYNKIINQIQVFLCVLRAFFFFLCLKKKQQQKYKAKCLKSQILHREWRSPSLCSEGGSEVWEPLRILPVQEFWWDMDLPHPLNKPGGFCPACRGSQHSHTPGWGGAPVLGWMSALGRNSGVAIKSLLGSLEINSVFKKILFIFTHYYFHSWRKQHPFSGKE